MYNSWYDPDKPLTTREIVILYALKEIADSDPYKNRTVDIADYLENRVRRRTYSNKITWNRIIKGLENLVKAKLAEQEGTNDKIVNRFYITNRGRNMLELFDYIGDDNGNRSFAHQPR